MTTCDIQGCRERGQKYYSDYWGYAQYLCPAHKRQVQEKELVHKLLTI